MVKAASKERRSKTSKGSTLRTKKKAAKSSKKKPSGKATAKAKPKVNAKTSKKAVTAKKTTTKKTPAKKTVSSVVKKVAKIATKAAKAVVAKKATKTAKPTKAVKAVKAVKAKVTVKMPPPKAKVTKAVTAPTPMAKKQATPKKAQKITAPAKKAGGTVDVIKSLNIVLENGKTAEDHCPNCTLDISVRRRDFSEQALTVLLVWGEINANCVDQPLCDDCYDELREVLIDRADEVEVVLTDKGVDRVREMVAKVAS